MRRRISPFSLARVWQSRVTKSGCGMAIPTIRTRAGVRGDLRPGMTAEGAGTLAEGRRATP